MRVLGDRVLVALPPESDGDEQTPSGLVLVRDPDLMKKPTRVIVVQLGEKSGTVSIDDVMAVLAEYEHAEVSIGTVRAEMKRLTSAPFDVSVGDHVLFPLNVGDEIELDGVNYVLLHESEVIAVVNDANERAVA